MADLCRVSGALLHCWVLGFLVAQFQNISSYWPMNFFINFFDEDCWILLWIHKLNTEHFLSLFYQEIVLSWPMNFFINFFDEDCWILLWIHKLNTEHFLSLFYHEIVLSWHYIGNATNYNSASKKW
jgi:hypothetical protein